MERRQAQPAAPDFPAPDFEEPASAAGWRILHIEPDNVDSMKLKLALRYELPAGSRIDHAFDWDEADQCMEQAKYDAVLAGYSLADPSSEKAFQAFVAEHNKTPVLLLSADDAPNAALVAGRCGARKFLPKSKLTSVAIGKALRETIRPAGDKRSGEVGERRKEPRYEVVLPAVIFPIQPDGTPGRELPATTVNLSQSGIALLAEPESETIPDICLVGVEGSDGVYRYAAVEWRHRRLSLPAICFGGRFLSRVDDPFHASRLTPRLDPERLRFAPQMNAAVLQEWVGRGILQSRSIDRVKSCPDCYSLPTFRDGCPKCGSAKTTVSQLVHHFACAHIAPLAEFEGEGLACPKCQAKNLIVGADYEYLEGPHQCLDCNWSDAKLELIAECLQCGRRFASKDAIEKEVFEYHVDRLDPLAFIANTD